MNNFVFNNPNHIIILGTASLKGKNAYDVACDFFENMEFYDYFSGQKFADLELGQIVNGGYDLVAIYDPNCEQVIDYDLSENFSHWLDCFAVAKEKIDTLVQARFDNIFSKENNYKSIFNRLIIGT